MRLRALITACLVVLGSLLGVLAHPANAATDLTVNLTDLSSATSAVLDEAHGQLFVGGGSTVSVRSLTGTAVHTISGLTDVKDLVLSADSSTLFAAETDVDSIAMIDTTSFVVTRFALPASTCPIALAVLGSKLWFEYDGCAVTYDNVGSVDFSTATPTVTTALAPASFLYAPGDLAVSATGPAHVIVNAQDGEVVSLDVSTDPPTVSAQLQDAGTGEIETTADGVHVLNSTSGQSPVYSRNVATLAGDGFFTSTAIYPRPIAVSPAGPIAVGYGSTSGPQLSVYSSTANDLRDYTFGKTLGVTAMTFDAAAHTLFAVTTDPGKGAVALHVLYAPTSAATAVTLTAGTGQRINTSYALKGTITSQPALPAGTLVHLVRDSQYGKGSLVPQPIKSDGSYTFSDKVTRRGRYGYTVSFPGDATHAASSQRIVITVKGLTPSLTLTPSGSTFGYHARTSVLAHLGSTTSRTLTLLYVYGANDAHGLKHGAVDSHGNLSTPYTLTRNIGFRVSFAGDEVYEPRTVSTQVLTRAVITQQWVSPTSTSGSYAVFPASKDPQLKAHFTPNNGGECMSVKLWQLLRGSWVAEKTNPCIAVGPGSLGYARLVGEHPAGTRWRVQVTLPRNDISATTTGGYTYVRFN